MSATYAATLVYHHRLPHCQEHALIKWSNANSYNIDHSEFMNITLTPRGVRLKEFIIDLVGLCIGLSMFLVSYFLLASIA